MSETVILKLKNELLELQGQIDLREKELQDLDQTDPYDAIAQSIQARMAKDFGNDAFLPAFNGENPYSKAPKASSGCHIM